MNSLPSNHPTKREVLQSGTPLTLSNFQETHSLHLSSSRQHLRRRLCQRFLHQGGFLNLKWLFQAVGDGRGAARKIDVERFLGNWKWSLNGHLLQFSTNIFACAQESCSWWFLVGLVVCWRSSLGVKSLFFFHGPANFNATPGESMFYNCWFW